MSTVYDRKKFETAYTKIATAPLELTAADFDQLEAISPTIERTAREALRLAQLAIVRQDAPIQTKAARPMDRSRRPVTRKHLHAFRVKFGTFLIEMVAKNVLPLREQVAALQTRVLELEAAAAAREGVSHADRR